MNIQPNLEKKLIMSASGVINSFYLNDQNCASHGDVEEVET